ncbi:MurR/RpiR family transcriptional regulator [uncultured Collinsella sp.]|uniref:MurR/RpiR family transcriptional regulator n=1 Tax=uncultured Collinsella sp. TaxID=165190 RepID=UPI0025E88ACB|nr:MurR/RpiR family transcriptional regulator [uncultured Collinsella sp.]
MNPIDELRRALPTLTKSELKAAERILNDPNIMLGSSITNLAKLTGSSNSAIIRMCQKLGYDGFAEFRFSFNRAMMAAESPSVEADHDDSNRLVDTYARYMHLIPQCVSKEQFDALAEAIVQARRLVIWGSNRTFQSAMQLSHRLTRLGIFNKPTDDAIVMSDDAAILESGDVCIVLSMQGRGNCMYGEDMDVMRVRGVDVHLVTMDGRSSLVPHASEVYVLPWISHDDSINFYEDQVIVYMFIEMLLLNISRNFS